MRQDHNQAVPLIERHGDGSPEEQQARERDVSTQPGAFTDVEMLPAAEVMSVDQPHSSADEHFERWLARMGFSQGLLEANGVHRDDLKALYQGDTAKVGWLPVHWLRPRSVEFMPERLWLALSLRPSWVSHASVHRSCWHLHPWIWVRGIAIPMVTTRGYAQKLLMSNLWRGGVAGFKLTLHGILLISLGIQLQKVIEQRPEDIWRTLHDGDSETWKRVIYDATGTSARLFWPMIFLPTALMALCQMVIQTTRTLARGQGRLVHVTADTMKRLRKQSIGRRWLRPCLPLDQTRFQLASVAHQLAFDGRPQLTPAYRQHATRYLITAIQHTHGLYRLLGLKLLAGLSVGTHIHNLAHDHEERLSSAAPLSHLMMRMSAKQALDAFMGSTPDSWSERVYREWAHYHGWMAGRKTHPLRIGVYVAMHMAHTAYFFYGFKVIIDAIQAYLDCPDKTGVSMTGVSTWSDDYTQPCFDAAVRFFRKIPGQPISFLLDMIHRVHFTERVITLDLSYKGVNGTEIALILEALVSRGVAVSSLDLTGNFLITAQAYQAFMPVLARDPHLISLILNDVGLTVKATPEGDDSALVTLSHWLPRLHLKAFSMQADNLDIADGARAMASALGNCTQLQSLDLISGGSYHIQPMVEAVSALPSFRSLSLSGFWIFDTQALRLAELLMERLTQLEHFGLRHMYNGASANATTTLMQALSAMHALKLLDFTGSMMDFSETEYETLGRQPVVALADAITALPDLTGLRLGHARLGYGGAGGGLALARALMDRAPLHVCELGFNFFSSQAFAQLNALLTQWQLPKMPIQLRSANETMTYLRSLPHSQTQIVLEDGPQNDESLSALFRGTAHQAITSINLKNIRFSPTARGFDGLGENQQLEALSLAFSLYYNTFIMDGESFLRSLARLHRLQHLSLSGSYLVTNDSATHPATLAQALKQLPAMTFLDLSFMNFRLTATLLETISQLPHLKQLVLRRDIDDVSGDRVGRVIVAHLSRFPALESLDVSQSLFGYFPETTSELARFLSQVNRPFYLNASHTLLGKHTQEAQALMVAIANNPLVTVSLEDASFSTTLWPPQVAQLASATYDPSLQAACSELQCFGVQPALPDLGNSSRIHFDQRHAKVTPPWHSLVLSLAILAGVGLIVRVYQAFSAKAARSSHRVGTGDPVSSASMRSPRGKVAPQPSTTIARPGRARPRIDFG